MGDAELVKQAVDLFLHLRAEFSLLITEVPIVITLAVELAQALHDNGDILRVPVLIHAVAQGPDAGDDAVEGAGVHQVPDGSLLHAHA